jgi:hypothetical protein
MTVDTRHGAFGTPEEAEMLRQGQCPVCGCRRFVAGPRGGLSVNVGCAECDSWWNLALIRHPLEPGPGWVWVHEPIAPPPEGARRTAPGPLMEVVTPELVEAHPECAACGGAGYATKGFFIGDPGNTQRVTCLCRLVGHQILPTDEKP